ncbi:MAG: PD40 domain-containing protein [Myxococcales bacterium]|nr:PD40 domain-containing protein [Myxococcales bacterium]
MRNIAWLTGVFGLVVACGDDGGRETNTQGNGTGTGGSLGSATDSEGPPTTSVDTGNPDTSASAGTPATMGETSDTTPPTGDDTGTTLDTSGPSTMTADTTDTGGDAIVSIEIDPLDAIVTVVDGAIPAPLQYKAYGITESNQKVPIGGSWSYDKIDLANIGSGNGEFSATGFAGGVGTVTFDAQIGMQASTSATVKLQYTGQPGDPATMDGFNNATMPDPAMTLLYPYDQTVFPRGLTGPVVQWDGGGAGDLYYIHAYSEFFDFKTFTNVPPPSRFSFPLMPVDIWLKLTASTEGPVKLDIQRFDGANYYLAKTQTWTIAPANLTGAVYYWEVNNGNVVRLNIGAPAPAPFINKPPGVSCVACHSVSKDGQRLVAGFHGGYSPWSTIDTATGNVLYFPDIASGFEAISPNGSHVLWGQSDETGILKLTTYDNATVLAQLAVDGGKPVHPAWSGDGNKIAFARRTDGNWLDFNNSELWITDVDLMNNSFANTHMIVDKQGAPLTTTTYPTFAPDSQWIAFDRLNQARTRGAVTEVWITNLDGSAQMRLDKANGVGIIEPGQDQTTYEPTFLPVSVGGYFWLIVGTERKYGNTLTDTNPGSRRKQLWVTAIDANVQPGVDPSHPPFWLPGQELGNSNMRGEWSLSPCKQIGEGCNAGFDCCDGFCYPPAPDMAPTCNDMPDQCSHIGDSCEVDSACCDGEGTCIGGFCSIMPG